MLLPLLLLHPPQHVLLLLRNQLTNVIFMRMRMQRGHCRKNDKETIGERPKVLSMVLFVLAKNRACFQKALSCLTQACVKKK